MPDPILVHKFFKDPYSLTGPETIQLWDMQVSLSTVVRTYQQGICGALSIDPAEVDWNKLHAYFRTKED